MIPFTSVVPGCVISSFITKPQPFTSVPRVLRVALYLLSSPNHNYGAYRGIRGSVALYLLSSPNHNSVALSALSPIVALYLLSSPNHNLASIMLQLAQVALYLLSSPNHNIVRPCKHVPMLRYIFFHHQTTTGHCYFGWSCSLRYIFFHHQTTTAK